MRNFIVIVSTVLFLTKLIAAQREGDLCVMAGTIQPGVCRHIMRCSPVLEAAFHGLPYQVCASPENRLIVCCPWVPGQETRLQAGCQANTTTPREGDNCTMVETGKAGVCSRFGNCPTAMEAASKGKFPQVCALERNVQVVCCPLVTLVEGDKCTLAETGRAGKCLRISKCPVAVEAALKGMTPQICALDGSVPVVCCEGVVEGSHCTLKNTGIAGVCRPFANCQTAKEAASKGIFQQRCDLSDNESELVCCAETDGPPLPKGLDTQLPTGSKAADYCTKLTEKTQGDICPLLTPDSNKVYHRTPITTAAEAPYYGRIGSGQRGAITWQGWPVSLVSDQWVLCTAWAIELIGSSNVQFVGLGGTFTPRYNPDEIYGVTKQFIHPLNNITYSVVYNDIALLQLDREVKFTNRILPVCLHTGTPLSDSGFILTERDRSSTEYKMSMQRVSQEECSRVLPTGSWRHPAGIKHDVEICSRPVTTTGGCPTCDVEGSVQIVCCPPVTVIEGDNCTLADTRKAGVCKPFATCHTAKEAASKGIFPQTCDVEGAVRIVCCPLSTVIEGSICLAKDTKIAGVYKPFANCQTAMKAASEGTLPQIGALEDNVQIVCCPLVIEGSNCTLIDTNMAGVCRSFANCQRAKKAAGRGVVPQRCDLTDNESELVCCAETDCPPLGLPIGSKAADYCIELAEKIHPCQETRSGWTRGDTLCPLLTPDSNIVYHKTPITTTAEAPYYGRIGSGQRGNITWRGQPVSLVSDQWVLCTARAIEQIGSSYVQFVGLGGTLTPRYNPDEIYGVTKQFIHPLYKGTYSTSYNNIALLQLDREVKFTNRILPVCLHTGTPLPESGFILTERDSSSTEYKMSMQRVSQEECSRVFPTGSSFHPAGIKHDVEICSRPVNTTGGCLRWYTGAPMILQNSNRVACTHLLVGLLSSTTTPPCTHTNTRISAFIPWIEGIVWPENGVVV